MVIAKVSEVVEIGELRVELHSMKEVMENGDGIMHYTNHTHHEFYDDK